MMKTNIFISLVLMSLLCPGVLNARPVQRSRTAHLCPAQPEMRVTCRIPSKRCRRLYGKKLYRMKIWEVDYLLRCLKGHRSYQQRLRLLSKMFLGGKYRFGQAGMLGEGPTGCHDQDPIFRLDSVDCVTYVETTMALARSPSLNRAMETLQKIRYKNGIIKYKYRNHFTRTQWVVNNEKAGYLRRITRQVGQKYARALKKPATNWAGTPWAQKIPRYLLPDWPHVIWYIPLKYIPKVLKRLPEIAWMGEVFDEPSNYLSISHVGMVLKQKGIYYFRHAGSVKEGVTQVPLHTHAKRRLKQGKIIGFSFARLLPPRPEQPF